MSQSPHVCPECGRTYSSAERFCEDCGMPLVHVPGPERTIDERRRLARKIKPQYADGRLVKVARAAHRPEAELIAALLLEVGIPSVEADIPDFLAAGPRDILVPESGAEAAREALVPAERPDGNQA